MIGRTTSCIFRPVCRRAPDVAGLVAIALRRRILLGPRALGSILFLEPIPRILVRAAWTPVGTASLCPFRTLGSPIARRGRRLFVELKILALRLA